MLVAVTWQGTGQAPADAVSAALVGRLIAVYFGRFTAVYCFQSPAGTVSAALHVRHLGLTLSGSDVLPAGGQPLF